MFKFFDMISAFLGTIVDSLVYIVKLVVYLFEMIGIGLTYVVTTVAYMPTFISGFCIVVFSLAVVFAVIQLLRG